MPVVGSSEVQGTSVVQDFRELHEQIENIVKAVSGAIRLGQDDTAFEYKQIKFDTVIEDLLKPEKLRSSERAIVGEVSAEMHGVLSVASGKSYYAVRSLLLDPSNKFTYAIILTEDLSNEIGIRDPWYRLLPRYVPEHSSQQSEMKSVARQIVEDTSKVRALDDLVQLLERESFMELYSKMRNFLQSDELGNEFINYLEDEVRGKNLPPDQRSNLYHFLSVLIAKSCFQDWESHQEEKENEQCKHTCKV